jgi:hypothetical protein
MLPVINFSIASLGLQFTANVVNTVSCNKINYKITYISVAGQATQIFVSGIKFMAKNNLITFLVVTIPLVQVVIVVEQPRIFRARS